MKIVLYNSFQGAVDGLIPKQIIYSSRSSSHSFEVKLNDIGGQLERMGSRLAHHRQSKGASYARLNAPSHSPFQERERGLGGKFCPVLVAHRCALMGAWMTVFLSGSITIPICVIQQIMSPGFGVSTVSN